MPSATALDFASDSERSALIAAHAVRASLDPRAAVGRRIRRLERRAAILGACFACASVVLLAAQGLAPGLAGSSEWWALGLLAGLVALIFALPVAWVAVIVIRPVRDADEKVRWALHVINRHAHRAGRVGVTPISGVLPARASPPVRTLERL